MDESDAIAHQDNVREQDLLFEEDVLRNPYQLKSWLRYLEAKQSDDDSFRNTLHERAVKELPGSYKLWYGYLIDRKSQVDDNCPLDSCWEDLNNTFERALVFLHKIQKLEGIPELSHSTDMGHHHNTQDIRSCFAGTTHHAARPDLASVQKVHFGHQCQGDSTARVEALSDVAARADRGLCQVAG